MKPKHPPKIDELTEDIQKVYDVLNNESDLACVLIGTSYLSELLGSLIMSQLKESNVSKNLLKPDRGAIGSFRARADLAYCLELINRNDYNDLLIIGDIRNGFAHKHLTLDFKNTEVQEACGKLKAYHILAPVLKKSNSEKIEYSKVDLTGNIRFQFVLSVVMISQRIYMAAAIKKKPNQSLNLTVHP